MEEGRDATKATWTSKKVPVGDCTLNVVLVYTDVLNGPIADLSIIAKSIEGKKRDGKWTITDIPGDLPGPVTRAGAAAFGQENAAAAAARAGAQKVTEKVLMDRTGYTMKHRDPENTKYDTGYDIIPR
jgi:hypothetical protein